MGNNNEEKFAKITCWKKNLERAQHKFFLLGILLCEWWERSWSYIPSSHEMYLCYDNVVNILHLWTKERKGLITYYKTYGITTLKKHVDADHFIIVKKFEEEINNEIGRIIEKQPTKKRPNVPTSAITCFFLL